MKALLKTLSLVALMALTMFSCKKPPAYEEPRLEVSPTEQTLEKDAGGQVTIQVQSNRKWTVTASHNENWYSITPISMEGENNGTVTVDVLENEGALRTLTLTFAVGNLMRSVTITQLGAVAENVLLNETFGTGAPTASPYPAIAAWDVFSKTGAGAANVTYTSESGTVSIRGNSTSNYPGASGNNNAMLGSTTPATLTIKNIASCGAQNLTLSFGSNQRNDTIAVFFSPDNGTTWTRLTYEKTTTEWGLVSIPGITLPQGTTCFALRFAAERTQYGARIDDITITTSNALGTAANCSGVIITDPDPATSLAEDFESFTSGTGAAYMSTQTNSKGWKGVKVQGELEPDVRTHNDNKYVQFSAHRSSITTASPQEFWLISPRLDLSAATDKTLSFDLAAGYYNANTVFEVYILDSDDPATATKTKLDYQELTDIPTNAYSAFASSGRIDLATHSGEKRIGFYYKGTSGSGNSTTYQIDNFIFGEAAFPELTVEPAVLSFDKAGEAKTFTVTSNREWAATSSDQTNFAVSTNGNVVTVTAPANLDKTRTATITVKATDGSIERIVNVSQSGENDPDVIYMETFGTPSATTIIANFTGWTKTGSGAGTVTYSGTPSSAVDVRTTSSSSGYEGASGGGSVFFSTNNEAERIFTISNINPGSVTNFTLTFGSQAAAGSLTLEYSTDGTNWTAISYEKTSTSWGLVTTNFSIPTTTSTLSLRFRTAAGNGTGNFRIDDVMLMENK